MYPVAILQLFDGSGRPAQNQFVAVPDAGSTGLLFGMGLAGLRFVASRRRHLNLDI